MTFIEQFIVNRLEDLFSRIGGDLIDLVISFLSSLFAGLFG